MYNDTDELIKLKQLLILSKVLLGNIFRDDTDRIRLLDGLGPEIYDNLRILWYELENVRLPKVTSS